jgi:hypothetical protein
MPSVKHFPPMLLLCLCAFGTLAFLANGADAAPAESNAKQAPSTPVDEVHDDEVHEGMIEHEADLDVDEDHLNGPAAATPDVTRPAQVPTTP